MDTSFFQIQFLIIDRLNEIFEGKIKISAAPPVKMSEIQERITGYSPIIYVFYNGYSAGSRAANNAGQVLIQTWTVMLVVRNYQNKPSEEGSIKEADKYINPMLSGLLGWNFKPQNQSRYWPLKLVNSPFPVILDKGAVGFPFSFETSYTLINNNKNSNC